MRPAAAALRSGWLLAVALAWVATACVAAENKTAALGVTFSPATRTLEIRGPDATADAHELTIETPGLEKLETGADVNEPGLLYLPLPPGVGAPEELTRDVENIFFFNELSHAPGWELVMHFDAPGNGTWKLNGRFSPLGGPQRREVAIPVELLEHGENLLNLRAGSTRPALFFRRRFGAREAVADSLTVLPMDWSGRVRLWRIAPGTAPQLVGEEKIATRPAAARVVVLAPEWWRDRDQVTSAALAVGRNILSAQVHRPGSPFEGGFNLVFDPSHKSYRMPHWIWSWGPSIDLLFRLSKLEPSRAAGLAEKFRGAAAEAAARSLQFGVTDPSHPAFGVSTVRWEPSRATPLGWAEYVSTADSLFMAGWGWMSAYRETRKPIYLERTTTLVAAAERLMQQYPVIPQDWIVERSRWTPHTLDESIFGAVAFRRLYETTKEDRVATAGRHFVDSHLTHMGRESGLLARAWMRDEDQGVWEPDIKGHAWVMEGYLDAYRLTRDAKYLGLARALADRAVACQADDGSWTYLFRKPAANDPIDDKGTAIWAYLLYDFYRETKAAQDLAAARRALGWCLRHQFHGDDPQLDGAILQENGMAYIR
ncbi:MAG: hypothetical protein JWM35_2665, partial [Verrucomicrobia bacterium]|nr:hypothetical protein [Verrucomicrobiota bacterium]